MDFIDLVLETLKDRRAREALREANSQREQDLWSLGILDVLCEADADGDGQAPTASVEGEIELLERQLGMRCTQT